MFNLTDKVKINEELCPENKRTEKKFQFGSLNYIVVMLEWEFEVERVFKDEYHGDMVEVKVLNVPNIRSNVVLKVSDLVLTRSIMLEKMNFQVLGVVNKNQDRIDVLKKEEQILVAYRNEKKYNGMAITDKSLITNWKEIGAIRASIKKLEGSVDKVFKVNHGQKTYTLDCLEKEIPRKLQQLISKNRSESKIITPKIKMIGGGMQYETVGGVLTKPSKFSELSEKFGMNIIKEAKVPKTVDNYVGIEVEMLSSKTIADMNKEFVKAKLHRYVNITTDASVQAETEGFHPMELRICLPEKLLDSKLAEICEVLRKIECYANKSCGMHVHLDMRARNPELCYRNLFKVQDIMLQVQPNSRRANRYCMPNTIPSLSIKEFNGSNDNGTRRRVINTMSYHKNNMQTIEIRVHEGTTEYKNIVNWVKFLVATATLNTELPTVVKNIKELQEVGYVDDKVMGHLTERVNLFSA